MIDYPTTDAITGVEISEPLGTCLFNLSVAPVNPIVTARGSIMNRSTTKNYPSVILVSLNSSIPTLIDSITEYITINLKQLKDVVSAALPSSSRIGTHDIS